jgi:WD40 repeat protein
MLTFLGVQIVERSDPDESKLQSRRNEVARNYSSPRPQYIQQFGEWTAVVSKYVHSHFKVSLVHSLAHIFPLSSIRFSYDGERLATVSDTCVLIFELRSGIRIGSFRYDEASLVRESLEVSFSRNGECVWMVTDSGNITVGDIATKSTKEAGEIPTPNSLCFSDDGSLLAEGRSREILIWDLEVGENSLRPIIQRRLSIQHHGPISHPSLAISRDGRLIAATIEHNYIWIGDTKRGLPFCICNGGDGLVDVEFSPTKWELLGCGIGGIKVWDLVGATENQQMVEIPEIKPRIFNGSYLNVWADDGNCILSALQWEPVELWNPNGKPQFVLWIDDIQSYSTMPFPRWSC